MKLLPPDGLISSALPLEAQSTVCRASHVTKLPTYPLQIPKILSLVPQKLHLPPPRPLETITKTSNLPIGLTVPRMIARPTRTIDRTSGTNLAEIGIMLMLKLMRIETRRQGLCTDDFRKRRRAGVGQGRRGRQAMMTRSDPSKRMETMNKIGTGLVLEKRGKRKA